MANEAPTEGLKSEPTQTGATSASRDASVAAAVRIQEKMQGILTGYAIYAAVRLGIPDALGSESMDAESLARAVGAHPRSTFRLLRALVALGLCEETGGKFTLTPEGSSLRSDSSCSVRNDSLRMGGMIAAGFSELTQSIRTGRTFYDLHGNGAAIFDWLARSPDEAEIFNRASAEGSRLMAPRHVSAYDFGRFPTIMDVGGGEGELLAAILRAAPNSRGILFEQPSTLRDARERLTRAGVNGRCELVGGNFFEGIPSGADAHAMRGVVHDWDDERSLKILRNSRRALPQNGRLILIERIMPERVQQSAGDRATTLADLNMLAQTGGGERTEGEYRALLEQAGFRLERVIASGPLLEAAPT
jgi:O-methyltransferase domain/Dimerisation domain